MRNNVTASFGPRSAGQTEVGQKGPSRRGRTARRGLLALPLALALLAPGATALAAEATTGYSQTTPPPPTTVTTTVTTTPPATQTTPTATQEVAPTQTSSTPTATHEVKPTSSSSPASTTPHATTLPFTGLDLRWVIVAGMLLLGTGLSIMFVQRGRYGAGR